MLVESRIGPAVGNDGAKDVERMTKDYGKVVQDLHGRYYEAVYRGTVYEAVTASTGVAPGTSLSTTAAFSLYNPISSGKNLVLIDVGLGYVSGTIGTGQTYLTANTNSNAAAVTGTAITPVNMNLASANTAVGKPLTTATLPAAQVAIHPLWILAPFLATSVFQPIPTRIVLDGKYIVSPGTSLNIHSVAAAGSSPLVVFSASWEEVAV
jgi:hypothetical protein